MKLIVVICTLLGIANAQQFLNSLVRSSPKSQNQVWPIFKIHPYLRTITGYSFGYNTNEGIQQKEVGNLDNPGEKDESLAVVGKYSYVGPDSKTYSVEYTADKDGFQPYGTHIPKSAGVRKLGIPPAALASLAGGGLG